jgi:hypothetical protein
VYPCIKYFNCCVSAQMFAAGRLRITLIQQQSEQMCSRFDRDLEHGFYQFRGKNSDKKKSETVLADLALFSPHFLCLLGPVRVREYRPCW